MDIEKERNLLKNKSAYIDHVIRSEVRWLERFIDDMNRERLERHIKRLKSVIDKERD